MVVPIHNRHVMHPEKGNTASHYTSKKNCRAQDSNPAKEPPHLVRGVSRKPAVLRRILLSVGVPDQQSSMTGEADPGGSPS